MMWPGLHPVSFSRAKFDLPTTVLLTVLAVIRLMVRMVVIVMPITPAPCLIPRNPPVPKTRGPAVLPNRINLGILAWMFRILMACFARNKRPLVWKSIPRFSQTLSVAIPSALEDGAVLLRASFDEPIDRDFDDTLSRHATLQRDNFMANPCSSFSTTPSLKAATSPCKL
jgi:hypothetical protein